ncbi:MAG: hypothetical protein ACLP50_38160 [Solirubrobacteraceae bacterium]
MVGLVIALIAAGCGAAAAGGHHPAAARSVQYVDPQGWSLRYPSSLSVERSTSGAGLATFIEVTVANFTQRRAVVTGKTHDGGFVLVRPPLDHTGRFPANGVAFRMLLVEGGPAPIGTVADSRFPIELSTFARSGDDFPATDYTTLGVPHELTRPIDADGQHYQALVLIGPAASARERAVIETVIASLSFPPLHTDEQAGDETVVRLASSQLGSSFEIYAIIGVDVPEVLDVVPADQSVVRSSLRASFRPKGFGRARCDCRRRLWRYESERDRNQAGDRHR